jgi:hypothetical protein
MNTRIEQLKEELAEKFDEANCVNPQRKNEDFASAIITTLAPFLNLDKPEEEWPKAGSSYWCGDSMSDVYSRKWDNDKIDQWRKATNNIFRTEAEALAHRDAILAGTVRVVVEKVNP